MKKLAVVLSLILSLGMTNFAFSQAKEGEVTFTIDMDSEDLNPMVKFALGNSKLTLRFKEEAFRSDFEMSVMEQAMIFNAKEKKGLMLMSFMGSKTAVKLDEDMFADQQAEKDKVEVELLDETKEIAGYTCKKAIVRPEGQEDVRFTLYYTDEIVPEGSMNPYSYSQIKGMPLQMEIELQGNMVTMVAEEVKLEKQRKDLFLIKVPEGYTLQDASDLQRL